MGPVQRLLCHATFCCIAFILASCTAVANQSVTPTEGVASKPTETTSGDLIEGGEAPVKIQIGQAFIDPENKLNIKVYLTPQTAISPSELAVTVLGLANGMVQTEETKRVSEVYPVESIGKGEAVAIAFVLPAVGLTEYQVRCSWGDDAKKLIALANTSEPMPTTTPEPTQEELSIGEGEIHEKAKMAKDEIAAVAANSAASGSLQLTTVEVRRVESTCELKPCDELITLRAKLLNNTSQPQDSIKLAIRLIWLNEGESAPAVTTETSLRGDEELVELEEVNLQPGAEKTINVKIDRPVPVIPGGAFLPILRLLPPT